MVCLGGVPSALSPFLRAGPPGATYPDAMGSGKRGGLAAAIAACQLGLMRFRTPPQASPHEKCAPGGDGLTVQRLSWTREMPEDWTSPRVLD